MIGTFFKDYFPNELENCELLLSFPPPFPFFFFAYLIIIYIYNFFFLKTVIFKLSLYDIDRRIENVGK
jgi:hypothetical protein